MTPDGKPVGNMIGQRVRQLRLSRGISLQELHDRVAEGADIELSQPTLTRIEQQERSVYDFEIVALAQALDIDVRWLLGLSEERLPFREQVLSTTADEN